MIVPKNLLFCHKTHPGKVRENNEDQLGVFLPKDEETLAARGVLAIVADGMGGAAAGEVASGLAVSVIQESYFKDLDGDPQESLVRALYKANEEILAHVRKEPNCAGMGTTATALVLCQGLAFEAHVGDSRLYLARRGNFSLLSQDHTMVSRLVEIGMLSPEKARHDTRRHILFQALGSDEIEVFSPPPLQTLPGDKFLLCSDGLHDLVEDQEIESVLLANPTGRICRALIDLALERGGTDNISVVALEKTS